MIKKAIVIMLTVCISLVFCGCVITDNTTDMVSPPELTGEMSPIAQALYASAGEDCDLKYPETGDHRSAIVLEDVDGDSIFEAFAFYTTSEDEMTTMHVNVICQEKGKWISVADQTVVANGVERVEFCDLNGNGTEEILIGWEVSGGNEKQLSVFTFEKHTMIQQILQPYTDFMCCDLDSNGINEIFVHLLNTAEKTNKAMIYNYNEHGIAQTTGCVMDGSVKSTAKPILSTLSNGQKAIYIDETKGVGAVTEVLYMSKGEIVNPLLDNANSFENILTWRAAALEIKDINEDGLLEIPVASDLPNAGNTDETLYYTNWCSFNGEKLSVKQITVVNTVDGYYLNVPNALLGKIAVLKDIENHERTFYSYDAKNDVVDGMIFKISAIEAYEWDSEDFVRDELFEVSRKDDTVFACKLGDRAQQLGITRDAVKDLFNFVK